MKLITRVFGGAYLQSTQLPGLPFILKPFTTLNERFAVQADQVPTADQMPALRYWTIGNGGHDFIPAANGIGKPTPLQHRATDAGLYSPIPFVLREPVNDLTPAQRLKYRLRVPMQIGGVNYIAYYAKVIDYTGVAPQMELQTRNEDGTVTVIPFVPNSSNLNPTPPDVSPTGVNVVTGEYVNVATRTPINLTADDVAELVNVANILYGDPDLAIISEVALCSGVDKSVTGGGNGQPTITYTEAIACQINTIFNAFYALQYADEGINILMDIGSTEPLLHLVNQTA